MSSGGENTHTPTITLETYWSGETLGSGGSLPRFQSQLCGLQAVERVMSPLYASVSSSVTWAESCCLPRLSIWMKGASSYNVLSTGRDTRKHGVNVITGVLWCPPTVWDSFNKVDQSLLHVRPQSPCRAAEQLFSAWAGLCPCDRKLRKGTRAGKEWLKVIVQFWGDALVKSFLHLLF